MKSMYNSKVHQRRERIVDSKLKPEAEIWDMKASLQQNLHVSAAKDSKNDSVWIYAC